MSEYKYGGGGGGSEYWQDAVADYAHLPTTATAGTVILVKDINKMYIWSGTAWVEFTTTPSTTGDLTESTSNVLTITNGTGAALKNVTIEVDQADASNDGYLSSTDWNTFNNKEPAQTKGSISETTSSVLTISNGSNSTVGPNVTIQVSQSDSTHAGYLSSADWNTFNNKQPAGSYELTTNKDAANGYCPLDANKLVPVVNLPPSALERLVIVADQAARYALTTATVQNGDTVKQTDTNEMFFVKDDTQLNNANGYAVYNAGTASAVAWSGITSKPTTIAGFGITDAVAPAVITTPAVDDLPFYNGTNWVNRQIVLSGGCLAPATYTDNGGGSITVDAVSVNLWNNSTFVGLPRTYSLSAITATLTDNTTNYIVGNYNSGSPILQVITDVNLITESDIVPVLTVYRAGTYLHILDWDALGIGLSNKTHQSIVKTQRYRRESGLAISESGTRNVNLTAGVVWTGANRVSLTSIASATDNIFFYYHVAGVWTLSLVTQYNNTQYDNGTDLATLTNRRYAVNWLYRGAENPKHLYMVLGTGDFQLPAAQKSQPPALPPAISSHAVLVGRIIVVKNAATATQIDSAFDVTFSTTSISNHNDLSSLQGGTTSEYYHLTSSEYSKLEITDIESKSANFTAATKKTYLVDSTSVAISVQLPTPALNLRITIKDSGFNAHVNNITLVRAGTEKIEGVAASYVIDSAGASVRLVSNGTDWFVI